MALYKYLDEKYLLAFWETGSMRIGTLSDFRNTEQHGEEIGDADEGIKSVTMGLNPGRYDESNPVPFGPAKVIFEPGGYMQFDGEIRIGTTVRSPDSLIYCMTEESDMQKVEEMGYASGFRIDNVERFSEAITEAIIEAVNCIEFVGIGRCNYTERDQDWMGDTSCPPELIKPPKYEYQREHRIVWKAKDLSTTLDPIIIQVPDCRQYCSKV